MSKLSGSLEGIDGNIDLVSILIGRAVNTHHQVPSSLGGTLTTARFGLGVRSGSHAIRLNDNGVLAVG